MKVVMLAFPGMTQLDLTGPLEILARLPQLEVEVVARHDRPIPLPGGLSLLPSHRFGTCSQADILFVSGGPGQVELMEDGETLEFLRRQAGCARFVTSVCTGSLLLAAAGLLTGYRATCHWLSLDQLALFGAVPVAERIVVDRDRITGAGVTSGIDFALLLAGLLFGEQQARAVQLAIEYDPRPPFGSGGREWAGPPLVEHVERNVAAFQARRAETSARAAARLAGGGRA